MSNDEGMAKHERIGAVLVASAIDSHRELIE